jgi:hypothetical protein
MDIAPIKTRRDYRHALKRTERLMTAKCSTPEGDCLDVLVTLVEAWERRHYPLDFPDPVEAKWRRPGGAATEVAAEDKVRGNDRLCTTQNVTSVMERQQ